MVFYTEAIIKGADIDIMGTETFATHFKRNIFVPKYYIYTYISQLYKLSRRGIEGILKKKNSALTYNLDPKILIAVNAGSLHSRVKKNFNSNKLISLNLMKISVFGLLLYYYPSVF